MWQFVVTGMMMGHTQDLDLCAFVQLPTASSETCCGVRMSSK